MKREPLMTQAYFEEAAQYLESTISKRSIDLDNPSAFKKPQILARANFRDSCELLITRYSKGDPVSELYADFEAIIGHWERFQSFGEHGQTNFEYLDDYVRSLWIASLARVFNADGNTWDRLLRCAKNEGHDRLFERIASVRPSDRAPATRLAHSEIYEPLDSVWDLQGDSQLTKISAFLGSWYKKLNDIGWHDCHLGPEGGGFCGYWAMEVAAVVIACDIDDSSFRDFPYYPKDLTAFARR